VCFTPDHDFFDSRCMALMVHHRRTLADCGRPGVCSSQYLVFARTFCSIICMLSTICICCMTLPSCLLGALRLKVPWYPYSRVCVTTPVPYHQAKPTKRFGSAVIGHVTTVCTTKEKGHLRTGRSSRLSSFVEYHISAASTRPRRQTPWCRNIQGHLVQ
jgi:hypothetical protein